MFQVAYKMSVKLEVDWHSKNVIGMIKLVFARVCKQHAANASHSSQSSCCETLIYKFIQTITLINADIAKS